MKVTVSHVLNGRNLAIQPSESLEDLDKILDYCMELPDVRPGAASVRVGTIWAAVFEEDGHLYRSLVQSVDEVNKKATVFFIDYGNSETVELDTGFRHLTRELLEFAPQMYQVQYLYADMPNAMEELDKILDAEEEVTATVVETTRVSSEMPWTFGKGLPPIVVSIKEVDEILKSPKELDFESQSKMGSNKTCYELGLFNSWYYKF